MEYPKEDDLMIQSYFTSELLLELHKLNFLESDYYKNAEFEDKFIHEKLPSIGIGNRGALMLIFYSLLVIPKELIEHKYKKEFKDLNPLIENIKSKVQSDYKSDSKKINYIQHIRNSIAHARVEFTSEQEVVFLDKNEYSVKGNKVIEKCSITIPLVELDSFINQLKKILFNHLKSSHT